MICDGVIVTAMHGNVDLDFIDVWIIGLKKVLNDGKWSLGFLGLGFVIVLIEEVG